MIILDAKSSIGNSGVTATSQSLTYTVAAGLVNPILLAGIGWNSTSITITSVTYNGVAMTQAGSTNTSVTGLSIAWYYLVRPTLGSAQSITANFSSTCFAGILGASFSGVDQDNPILTTLNNTIASGTNMATVLSPTSPCTIVDIAGTTQSSGFNATAVPQKALSTDTNFGSGGTDHIIDSYLPTTASGSSTITETLAFSSSASHVLLALRPYIGFRPNNIRPRAFAPGTAR